MKLKNGDFEICDNQQCCGCGACAQICPRHCIDMLPDPEGFLIPVKDSAVCSDCGLCRKVCQFNSASYHVRDRIPAEYHAARLCEPAERVESSSGGAWFACAKAMLKQNAVVSGVRFDSRFVAELALGDKLSDLADFRSSKYVQSHPSDVYLRIRDSLNQGCRVFFTGTPCQVAGLYAFLGRDPENLVTADFVCHGAPSPMVFSEYLAALSLIHKADPVSVNFRDKSQGWTQLRLTIRFKNGTQYSRRASDDPYYLFFLAGGMNRTMCYQCPYTRCTGRQSDLTFADAWRAGALNAVWNDNTGISAFIVNSAKGEQLLKSIPADEMEVLPCTLDVLDQHYLHAPAAMHPDRKAFFRAVRTEGAERALIRFSGPRPLLRRIRSRFDKIIHRIWSRPS